MANRAKVDVTLEANRIHQAQMQSYIQRLESELSIVDNLLRTATIDPEEGQESSEFGIIDIPGASKPTSLILQSGLLSETSPFYADAKWRETYEYMTTLNPMKGKEQEALRRAVRTENQRISVLAAQAQGNASSVSLEDMPATFYEKNKEGLDWHRIVTKISDSVQSLSKRKPEECEIRWLGHLHPDINKSPWTSKELADLKDLIQNYDDNPVDWTEVSQKLGTGRSPMDCMCHGANRRVHTWDAESDKKLLDSIQMYGENNWTLVAMTVSEDVTAHQCQKRFCDTLDPSIKHGPWLEEEDARILRAVAAFSSPGSGSSGQTISWQDVALFVPGRTNNQCREHYQAKFKTKGTTAVVKVAAKGWSEEEDVRLREAVAALPEGQWDDISVCVGGEKTEDMCRKRFRALNKKDNDTVPQGAGTEAHNDLDAPPAKRARKSAAPKPRTKKAKSVEATDEQTSDPQPSIPTEASSAQGPKRRVRPRPGMLKKGREGLNIFGEVEKGAGPEGSGSGASNSTPAEGGVGQEQAPSETLLDESSLDSQEPEMQLDESQPTEQITKRGRLSAKARGKQKANAQETSTNDATAMQQPPEQDNSFPTISAAQKKRTGRKPKAKVTEPAVDPCSSSRIEDGADGDTGTSTPMEIDEPEPSNRRRSARLKSTKG